MANDPSRDSAQEYPWRVPITDLAEPVSLASPEDAILSAPVKYVEELSREDEEKRLTAVLKLPFPKDTRHGGKGRRATPKVKLPPVPTLLQDISNPYFFGWAITHEWLGLVSKCATPYIRPNNPGGDTLEATSILRNLSGASNPGASEFTLGMELVVHPRAPIKPPGDEETTGEFWMVSICSTAFEYEYVYMRPTEEQYRWLSGILPGEPQWFRSVHTMESYVEILACLLPNH